VDAWLEAYNERRPHSGRFCYGKTPMQTFENAKTLAQEKNQCILIEDLSDSQHLTDRAAQAVR
jgi:hypothetical protein